jgi:hypothetical protein
MLVFVVFSLAFAMVAVLVALWFGDKIVLHPRRWALAAIIIPMLLVSVVFGLGAMFSLYLSVPAAALFLILNRKWPLPTVAG